MRWGAFIPDPVPDMPLVKFSARVLLAAILALPPALPAAENRPANRLIYADDLAQTAREAAARRVPVMIVFTEASCPYCARAKREFIVPMQSRGPLADKVVVREVDVASGQRLRDFDGRLTTHREFARRERVRKVPTVVVVDARGAPVAEPIVGLLIPDFYGLYLEQSIEAGLHRLRYEQ